MLKYRVEIVKVSLKLTGSLVEGGGENSPTLSHI